MCSRAVPTNGYHNMQHTCHVTWQERNNSTLYDRLRLTRTTSAVLVGATALTEQASHFTAKTHTYTIYLQNQRHMLCL